MMSSMLLRPFARALLSALLPVVLLGSFPGAATLASAQSVEYTLSFPVPQERWMQVEVKFPAVPGRPLDVRMSRSSPGRYATHEFAKNVYALEATTATGARLAVQTVRPDVWRITPADRSVIVRYRIFGDHVDGTYLAVDQTHAHINMPAALIWSPAHRARDARVTLVQPAGQSWRAATQLFPTADPLVFTAPNLQYLFDSPIEFSDLAVREFTVAPIGGEPAAVIRVALHHLGTGSALDAFTRDVERIVLEQRAVFGELPSFDGGTYTFLLDYLPWADGDGMEHRNSTVCTSSASLDTSAHDLLGTVSHEFFHAWNVERIRPASLEPFDFTQANMSGELWLAEGFTSYYGELLRRRAGVNTDRETFATFARFATQALTAPGVQLRSAVEMSRLAPFVDAAAYVDRTNWENTFLSYYTYGAAIAMGLDLTLRQRSDGAVSLDDYMQALWRSFGRVPAPAPGLVARPYTLKDLRDTLAVVARDRAFADSFFARHIEGREPIDFAALLAQAGLSLTSRADAPWVGEVSLEAREGTAVVSSHTVSVSPAYQAGLDQDDEIVSLEGRRVRHQDDWDAIISAARVGATLDLAFRSRGVDRHATLTVVANPQMTLAPIERQGAAATDAQQAFRRAWLESKR